MTEGHTSKGSPMNRAVPEMPKVESPMDLSAPMLDPRVRDMLNEYQSRQISWLVGRTKEHLAALGFPQGPLPEGFIVDRLGPSLDHGRRGSPVSWAFNEPLAAHIKEGARRFLAGASFADLAAWSQASPFAGRTPKDRPMIASWWRGTSTNPKYAGLHLANAYTGYKSGAVSPRRRLRNDLSQLTVCRLPALISPEDFRRIVEIVR